MEGPQSPWYPVKLVTGRNTCSHRSLTNRCTFFPQKSRRARETQPSPACKHESPRPSPILDGACWSRANIAAAHSKAANIFSLLSKRHGVAPLSILQKTFKHFCPPDFSSILDRLAFPLFRREKGGKGCRLPSGPVTSRGVLIIRRNGEGHARLLLTRRLPIT